MSVLPWINGARHMANASQTLKNPWVLTTCWAPCSVLQSLIKASPGSKHRRGTLFFSSKNRWGNGDLGTFNNQTNVITASRWRQVLTASCLHLEPKSSPLLHVQPGQKTSLVPLKWRKGPSIWKMQTLWTPKLSLGLQSTHKWLSLLKARVFTVAYQSYLRLNYHLWIRGRG